jgi:hypothetical protein
MYDEINSRGKTIELTPLHPSLIKRGLSSTAYKDYELSEHNKTEMLRKSHGNFGTLNNSLDIKQVVERKSCLNPFLSKTFNTRSKSPSLNSHVRTITKVTSFGDLSDEVPNELNNSNIFERAD